MKFGDKLIKLRKKNGLSQEELAAKLNVSRQSVSKWESNNTYPETDKIVQICNIFDCTMDDLINENIKDITTIERSYKNQLSVTISSLLEFITKTINMFCHMRFLSIIKCLIEQAIIIGVLILISLIISEVFTSVIGGLFSFLPWEILHIIKTIFRSIIVLVFTIIIIIIVIHIFKIRYLNYYDEIVSGNSNNEFDENIKDDVSVSKEVLKIEKQKVKLENKEPRIIIRDKEPFLFLNVLAKMILGFIKILGVFILLFFAFVLLLGIIGLVLSISLSFCSNIFIGLDIGIIGLIIGVIFILILLINFILEKRSKVKLMICLFFASIIVTGIGIGISLVSLKDFKFLDNLDDVLKVSTQEERLSYVDNMVIVDNNPRTYEYIINNDLKDNEIIVQNDFDPRFYELSYYEEDSFGMKEFNFYLDAEFNFKNIFDIFIDDIKNNIIRDDYFYYNDIDIKIVANDATVSKLMKNFSKIYNYKKESTDDGFIIFDISRRIKFIYDECYGEYNVLSGKFKANDDCKCVINEELLPEKVEYSCHIANNE